MITKGNPGITFISPRYENSIDDELFFLAEFEDKNSDLVKVLTMLNIDFKDVTAQAQINYSSNRKGEITYKFPKALKPELHSAILSVANKSGGTSNKVWEFIVR